MSDLTVLKRVVSLAWRNVLRNWRHTLATILAIATGFMAISLFDGFIDELIFRTIDGYSRKGMFGHLVIQHKGAEAHLQEELFQYSLTGDEQKFLDDFLPKDPAFDHRVRFLNISGMISTADTSSIFIGFAYDLEEGLKMRGDRWAWDTTAGKPLYQSPPQSIIVGGGLGEILGCKAPYKGNLFLPEGNLIPEIRPLHCEEVRVQLSSTTESAQINALEMTIQGTYDAGYREVNKRAIHISLADAQKLLDTDKISMMSVRLHSERDIPAFVARLRMAAQKQNMEFDVMPWLEHSMANYAKGGLGLLSTFRNLFMTIVILISVMAVANTMMRSVNERIREIGTLRSIGYLRHHIQWLFACEGLFISLIACSIGLVLTLGACVLVESLDIKYKAGVLSMPITLQVAYVPLAWLGSAAFLSLLAVGTAWYSSRKASKMVLADAIRHV